LTDVQQPGGATKEGTKKESMMVTVSVLCARVRIEEKLLIQALVEAGVSAAPVPPEGNPLDLNPSPSGPFSDQTENGREAGLVLDRCQDRTIGAAVVALHEMQGARVFSAGLAATGSRLDVMMALTKAGLPLPKTMLAPSEGAGLLALDQLGYPATLMPLRYGKPGLPILDRDSAEAVLEHRDTLGGVSGAMTLLQAGVYPASARTSVIVVKGSVVGIRSENVDIDLSSLEIAESAAVALRASIVGIDLVSTDRGWAIWDVNAVPELRQFESLGGRSIYGSIVDAIVRDRSTVMANAMAGPAVLAREVADGIVLSA
jgi:[lysine-biosynthesis-protein LysW]---L-2-aminoadipate ligase